LQVSIEALVHAREVSRLILRPEKSAPLKSAPLTGWQYNGYRRSEIGSESRRADVRLCDGR